MVTKILLKSKFYSLYKAFSEEAFKAGYEWDYPNEHSFTEEEVASKGLMMLCTVGIHNSIISVVQLPEGAAMVATESYNLDTDFVKAVEWIKSNVRLTYEDIIKKLKVKSLRIDVASHRIIGKIVCINMLMTVAEYLSGNYQNTPYTFRLTESVAIEIVREDERMQTGMPGFDSLESAKKALEILGKDAVLTALRATNQKH